MKNKIDIIHFQNIHGNYIGLLDIWLLSKIRPCIVTMHDMWDLTGNCVHANSCTEYQRGCLVCRMDVGNRNQILRSSVFLKLKQLLLTSNRICYVSPATWLLDAGRHSILKRNHFYHIPNGVNTENFCFQSKQQLRQKYQLDIDKKYIVFLSYDTSDRKKGLPVLLDALKGLEKPEEYVLITAGKKMKQKAALKQYRIIEFGYTNDDKKLNEIYALGDIFIIPSMEDTFPCTVLEAMASGTPVVGFMTGGIVEQVTPETGFLTNEKSAIGLREIIQEAFRDRIRLRNMSIGCHERAVNFYQERKMLQAYKRLYKSIRQ